MNRYGRNFVVYISNNNSENKYSKSQLLDIFNGWIEGKRQRERIIKDFDEIMALPNRRYAYTTRQYTGHEYYPTSMKIGKRVFVSQTVDWS